MFHSHRPLRGCCRGCLGQLERRRRICCSSLYPNFGVCGGQHGVGSWKNCTEKLTRGRYGGGRNFVTSFSPDLVNVTTP
ncbi:hypothetical protein B0H10DRAFT_753071 [Mycena sp. CBHHK59/15]|nr:hypothetical protein B0H10DRAFT_753071 [Mycena sp. CBHHK59/15]